MKFPISSLVMIGIAGILLFMFIMFNYAFHDPDVGIKEKLNESAQKTMTGDRLTNCLLYTSPSPRDRTRSRMPSSA